MEKTGVDPQNSATSTSERNFIMREPLTAISLPMPWFAPVTNARRLTAAAAIVCVGAATVADCKERWRDFTRKLSIS
jgi:hypothetical protein